MLPTKQTITILYKGLDKENLKIYANLLHEIQDFYTSLPSLMCGDYD